MVPSDGIRKKNTEIHKLAEASENGRSNDTGGSNKSEKSVKIYNTRDYDKKRVLAARMFIVDGRTYEEISEELGVTVPLLKKWSKSGLGNGGIPWEEARNITLSRVKSATAEVELERLKTEAREALDLLLERYRSGKARATFADLPNLAKFLLELENLDAQKLEFMRRFLREVARILARHIKDPRTLMLISTELDALVDRFAKEMISVDKWIK